MGSQRTGHYWAINTFNWSPCVCVGWGVLVTELCTTLCHLMDYIAQQSRWISKNIWKFYPWNSPSKNTGVGWHSLLQGIFSTQGSNPGLLHWRQILDWWPAREALIGLHVSGVFHPFCRPGSSHLGCRSCATVCAVRSSSHRPTARGSSVFVHPSFRK